jgi:hypothetical protein
VFGALCFLFSQSLLEVGVLLVMTAGRTVDFFFRKDLPARLTEINFGSNTSFVNRTKSQDKNRNTSSHDSNSNNRLKIE